MVVVSRCDPESGELRVSGRRVFMTPPWGVCNLKNMAETTYGDTTEFVRRESLPVPAASGRREFVALVCTRPRPSGRLPSPIGCAGKELEATVRRVGPIGSSAVWPMSPRPVVDADSGRIWFADVSLITVPTSERSGPQQALLSECSRFPISLMHLSRNLGKNLPKSWPNREIGFL